MDLQPFKHYHFETVSEALDIAEDKIGDFYKFSTGQWKRHRYDVKTLSSLDGNEISDHAFALLNKGERLSRDYSPEKRMRDFYFICLQDHQILGALKRDSGLELLPLLVYIFAHELVHIVRFCNFSQRFEVSGEDRNKEECIVHGITYDILKKTPLSKLDYVLDSYREYRICEMRIPLS